MKVSTPSRKEEKLFKTSSAIYVITKEEIRRSGLNTVPELLRLVPGVQVARLNSNDWAVGVRGQKGRLTSNLLVLMDGRAIYSPILGGTFWSQQSFILENIERIEVIRGPGATLWGPNAFNGIINIITKNSNLTQNNLISGGTGTEDKGVANLRFSGKIKKDFTYRVSAQYFKTDEYVLSNGENARDNANGERAEFRMDWEKSLKNSFSFQGAYSKNKFMNPGSDLGVPVSLTQPFAVQKDSNAILEEYYFLGRWKHTSSNQSDMALQLYYDYSNIEVSVNPRVHTFDIDFQHRSSFWKNNEVLWGIGNRTYFDRFNETFDTVFTSASRVTNIFTAFIQDQITIVPNKLALTVGSKLQINPYTKPLFHPTVRLTWTPNDKNTLWAAFSRPTKIPSRGEDNSGSIKTAIALSPDGTPIVFSTSGNLNSDEYLSNNYEVGYRIQLNDNIFVDATGFYFDIEKNFSLRQETFFETNPQPEHLVVANIIGNEGSGESYGIELATKWKVFDYWKLNFAWNWLERNQFPDFQNIEEDDPKFQFSARSYFDLFQNFEIDSALYYVGQNAHKGVPGYTRLDLRLGWHPKNNLELSFSAQNLLDPQHPEDIQSPALPLPLGFSEVQRSYFGKLTYLF